MDDVYTKLRIEARSGGKVREVAEFLSALENAYNNLYAIDFFVSSLEDLDRKRRYLRHPQYPIPFERIEGLILPEDELRLDSVIIESPGWWEVLGIPKLLETLRKYLNDRHERKKDSEFRNKYEERKKELGLEKTKTEIFRERIDTLKEAGFSKEEIRRMIVEHGTNPLSSLDKFQDSNLIGGATTEPADGD